MGLARSLMRSSSSGIATPEKWLVDWFKGGLRTAAGVDVTHDNALTSTAFFAGVRVLAEDVGSLPLFVYEREQPRGKRRAVEHAVYELLHDQPNPLMTAMAFREALQGHVETWGGGYASIEWSPRGQPRGLWPLHPGRLKPEVRRQGVNRVSLTYLYDDQVNGIRARLLPDEVLHVAGFGFDGVRGYSLVELHRNAIGLALAAEHYGASWFRNGSRPSGVLQTGGTVSDKARARLKEDFDAIHKGLDNAQRVAILEEGITWQQVGIPPEDAQFLQTRTFQVDEMARILRMPPHKLAELTRATFSNIEHQGLDYVVSSLRPRLVRWEQAIAGKLFVGADRRRFFAEHLVDGLLRGDIQSRYAAYATGRQWGWLSADDIAELENRNPLPDGKGSVYLVPLNMVPAPSPEEADAASAGGRRRHARSSQARRRIGMRFAPLIEDLDRRMARMEEAEVSSLVRRLLEGAGGSAAKFDAALAELYETVDERARDRWGPLIDALAQEVAAAEAAELDYAEDLESTISRFAAAYSSSHVAYRTASSLGQLRALLERDDAGPAIVARLEVWVAERPAQTVRQETVQLPEGTAREVWRRAGVRKVRWVADGDSCPFCLALDGRVVGIEQPFVPSGGELDGGEQGTITAPRNVFHPPVHAGCDCSLSIETE